MQMEKLKKIICLIISFCILSIAYTPVFAEETAAVVQDERAVMLNKLGLLKYDVDAEMYTQAVTHAQMVGTAVDLFGNLSEYFTYNEYSWPDINDIEEKNKIQLAADMGIIGKTWLFEPERSVTAGEAIQLLVTVMGYDELAKDKGGDILGYAAVARSIGLLDGISAELTDNLIWSDFIRMLYNLTDINIMKIYGYTADGLRCTSVNDVTLLNEYFNIYKAEGVISANENTAIDHGDVPDVGRIRVNQTILYTGETDAADKIGYYIKGYALKSGDTYTLLCYEDESENRLWNIDSEDLMPSHSDWSAFRIVYEDESGRTKQLSLPSNIAVIYNGKSLFDYTADDLSPKLGGITVIDNDLDGTPEVVSVNEYKNYIVDSIDAENGIVYTKDNQKLDFDSAGYAKLLSVNNDEYLLSELSEYAVLSLEISKDGDLIKGVVSKDKRSGIINQYRKERGKNYIYLDDDKIRICSSWDDLTINDKCSIDEDSVGGRYVVYLDKNGEAAYFIEKKSGEMYAFLYGCKLDGGFEKTTGLRVFTEDGTWNEYEASDKTEVFDKTTNTIKTVKSGEVGSNINYGIIGADRKAIQQMVKIEVDYKNEIVRICPPITRAAADSAGISGTDTEKKLLIIDEKNKDYAYRSASNTFGSDFKYALNSKSKVFSTPYENNDTTAEFDYDSFDVGGTGILRDDFTIKNIDVYDLSDMNIPGMIVLTRGVRANDYWLNGAYLVKSVITESDEDGEYISLECINKGNEVTLRAVNDDCLKNIEVQGVSGTYVTDVGEGDILTCHTDRKGRIDGAAILFDSSIYTNAASVPNAKLFQTVVGRGTNEAGTYYGEVLKKDGSYLLLNNGDAERVFNINGTQYIYSVNMTEKSGNKAFKRISAGEIPVGGKVMVFARGSIMQFAVYFAD